MAIKTIEVDWKGAKETVEFEDDISFGMMESIIKRTVDISDITKPKIDMASYRIGVLMAVLKKAPFTITDITLVRDVPRKAMNKIVTEVMKEYPLVDSLGDWMKSFLGSEEEIASNIQFTQPVPPSLDGINPPLIDNQANI